MSSIFSKAPSKGTGRFKDLDKSANGGLVLGLSQFSIPPLKK